MYLTEIQYNLLVYLSSLVLAEGVLDSASIEEVYLLNIPKRVKKEIN